MGLFSRKESTTGAVSQRARARSSLSSEAQSTDMRSRARRRLIGALALVVAAVIVVPMLIDTAPPEEQPTPVVVPTIPPVPAPGVAVLPPDGLVQEPALTETAPLPVPEPITGDAAAAPQPQVPAEPSASTAPPEPVAPVPEAKPKVETAQPKEPAIAERTDDGAVAIALLEGRVPARPVAPAATSQGNFVLQIAAYTTDKDAQARRQKLVEAGVTNAYVEAGTSSGKPTYRLRVGPFPTRDAAQAAQTRLRALGYENGFISSK